MFKYNEWEIVFFMSDWKILSWTIIGRMEAWEKHFWERELKKIRMYRIRKNFFTPTYLRWQLTEKDETVLYKTKKEVIESIDLTQEKLPKTKTKILPKKPIKKIWKK